MNRRTALKAWSVPLVISISLPAHAEVTAPADGLAPPGGLEHAPPGLERRLSTQQLLQRVRSCTTEGASMRIVIQLCNVGLDTLNLLGVFDSRDAQEDGITIDIDYQGLPVRLDAGDCAVISVIATAPEIRFKCLGAPLRVLAYLIDNYPEELGVTLHLDPGTYSVRYNGSSTSSPYRIS